MKNAHNFNILLTFFNFIYCSLKWSKIGQFFQMCKKIISYYRKLNIYLILSVKSENKSKWSFKVIMYHLINKNCVITFSLIKLKMLIIYLLFISSYLYRKSSLQRNQNKHQRETTTTVQCKLSSNTYWQKTSQVHWQWHDNGSQEEIPSTYVILNTKLNNKTLWSTSKQHTGETK